MKRYSISIERALIETHFYQENAGRYSLPVLRAKFFKTLCREKTIYIGEKELIVGERGPAPKRTFRNLKGLPQGDETRT
ncbi:pyruvate formate lyase family protein [uncultured Desulfobacter sp.]|nr:pyruvate formate lyase family protein [uncultured Desulfobacter sp.]